MLQVLRHNHNAMWGGIIASCIVKCSSSSSPESSLPNSPHLNPADYRTSTTARVHDANADRRDAPRRRRTSCVRRSSRTSHAKLLFGRQSGLVARRTSCAVYVAIATGCCSCREPVTQCINYQSYVKCLNVISYYLQAVRRTPYSCVLSDGWTESRPMS